MRKIFSISKKQTTILLTLLLLLTAALWYYLDYIPRNEQELDEQHFRWLRKADENIRAKIDGNDTLLSNLLNVCINEGTKSKNVEAYINSYTKNIDGALTYAVKPISSYSTTTNPHNISIQSAPDTASVQFSLNWDSLTNKLSLEASKNKSSPGLMYTVKLQYQFSKFINSLLIPHLFDHYVVFYKGNYIYEDFHSGLGYNEKDEDSLLKTGKAMTGANIIKQKVGGVDYQIFFQPINLFNGRIVVAGLLSQDKINTEKKQLPTGVVMLSISIALGILLFLPWIKIYFQGKYDKINLRDAAQSVVVTKLLMSLIVLLFFTYNTAYRKCCEDSKQLLADTISTAFEKEIEMADKSLMKFDTIIHNNKMFYDVVNLKKNNVKFARNGDIFSSNNYKDLLQKDSEIKNIGQGLQYIEVNWLDNTGRLKYGWVTASQNNLHASYQDRDYFKNVLKDNTISLDTAPDTHFVIDQVISRTTGAFKTTIAKESQLDTLKDAQHRAKVVALSLILKSLDSVIMPAGYNFAIITDDGKVRYHSIAERNLNENLLDEFSNKGQLQNALYGRFKEVFKTKYYENEDSVLVQPIKGLPYFIVIMDDQRFADGVQMKTFSFTWSMTIMFLLIVMIDLFVIISASSRRSLFKKQYIITSWLWPRACSRNEYRLAAIGNCILLAMLVLCFHHFNYLSYLFLLLFSIPLSTIFINSLYLHKYNREKNKTYVNYKVRCNIFSISLLVIINFFAFILLDTAYKYVLIFEASAIIIGYVLLRFNPSLWMFYRSYIEFKQQILPRLFNKNKKHEDVPLAKKSYINSYIYMIFTRLLITSGLPVIFFYTASYNFENNLLVKYRMYDFETQLQQKFIAKSLTDNLNYADAVYTDGKWIKTLNKNTMPCNDNNYLCNFNIKPPKLPNYEKNEASLFNYFTFYISSTSGVDDNFFHTASNDGYYRFNNFFHDVLRDSAENQLYVDQNTFTPASKQNLKYLKITSQNLNYLFPGLQYSGLIFWLFLAAAMFIFFIILREVINKICSLNLEPIPLLKDVNTSLRQLLIAKDIPLIWVNGVLLDELQAKVEANIGAANSITVLDFNNIKISDKKPESLSLQQMNENNYLFSVKPAKETETDWSKIKSDALASESKFFILLHFETNIDNEKINEEKLSCIQPLIDTGKKIIIISHMHPLQVHERLSFNRGTAEAITNEVTTKLITLILKNLSVITLPLVKNTYNENDTNQLLKNNSNISDVMLSFLNQETKYTKFLNSLRDTLVIQLQALPKGLQKFKEDKSVLRTQMLACNFYLGIWRTLSSEEKFVLYDLAADGLANICNTFVISQLLSKNLIEKKEGRLYIFNKSFRNFIVSDVDNKEITRLQLLHKKHSNWSNLQTPLLLFVIAIFIFLAIAQEGLYSKIIGIITGMAAGIPALLKIMSMVGPQTYKSSKKEQSE